MKTHPNEHRAKTRCAGFSAGKIPGLKALYQIHYDTQYGPQGNTPPAHVANGQLPQKGSFIRVSVGPQGDA